MFRMLTLTAMAAALVALMAWTPAAEAAPRKLRSFTGAPGGRGGARVPMPIPLYGMPAHMYPGYFPPVYYPATPSPVRAYVVMYRANSFSPWVSFARYASHSLAHRVATNLKIRGYQAKVLH